MDLIKQQAENDFQTARSKAFYLDILSHIIGKPTLLLPFNLVKDKLQIKAQIYRGIKTVEIDKIIGSVDRYDEFNNEFLPKKDYIGGRWVQINRAFRRDVPLPAVSLYQIGDAYFVEDGNHRISVAKELGTKFIDAEIVEFKTNVEIDENTDVKELILKSEYSTFLNDTSLDQYQMDGEILFSKPGRYAVLKDHIEVHRYFKGLDENRSISRSEAAISWYENLYLPMVRIFRKNKILKKFPKRTEADLYIWVTNHRYFLMEKYGPGIKVEQAVFDFTSKYKLSKIQAFLEKFGLKKID